MQHNKYINKILNDNLDIFIFPEYKSYYSSKYKYPLLVTENLKKIAYKPKIQFVRADIEDPFRKLENFDADKQLSTEDYQLLKEYGYSPGHNAVAGHHKTTMENWASTFYYINMTPQEIVLNAGIWLILEQWCQYLSKNKLFTAFYVLTGSIPNKENSKFANANHKLEVNIPSYMYKIVLAKCKNDNNLYYACFLCSNLPINPIGEARDINKYLINIDKLSNYANIDIYKLIKHICRVENLIKKKTVKKNKKEITLNFLGTVLPIKYDIKDFLDKSLQNATWFGKLIYSKTIEELDNNWKTYVELNEKYKLNRSLEYHKEYYDLAKQRITTNIGYSYSI